MRISHKGLRALHERGNPAHWPSAMARTHPGSANAPSFRLHPLQGDGAGQWSVRVTSNWRVVFRFEDGEDVDMDPE